MEVPDGWASDESEVSEVSDGGRGSGFFLDHPVDHPGALTETESELCGADGTVYFQHTVLQFRGSVARI